jgi:hypothetical protein
MAVPDILVPIDPQISSVFIGYRKRLRVIWNDLIAEFSTEIAGGHFNCFPLSLAGHRANDGVNTAFSRGYTIDYELGIEMLAPP